MRSFCEEFFAYRNPACPGLCPTCVEKGPSGSYVEHVLEEPRQEQGDNFGGNGSAGRKRIHKKLPVAQTSDFLLFDGP